MGTLVITTEEEALAVVRRDGLALKYVPDELITVELCLEAVKEHGLALGFVPRELRMARRLTTCRKSCGRKSAAGSKVWSDTSGGRLDCHLHKISDRLRLARQARVIKQFPLFFVNV